MRKKRLYKVSTTYLTDENRLRCHQQVKPLYRFIANKQSSSNTIKQHDGGSTNQRCDVADKFADAVLSLYTDDDGNHLDLSPPQVLQQHDLVVKRKGILKQLQQLIGRKGSGPAGKRLNHVFPRVVF